MGTSSSERADEPSVAEYTAFHSMVCGPDAARRCIDSFDGCALFASQDEYAAIDDLSPLDYARTPVKLNLYSYYLLVIVSFTGLSTLLGSTDVMLVREESTVFSKDDTTGRIERNDTSDGKALIQSKSHPDITIPPKILDYVFQQAQVLEKTENSSPRTTIRLTRRFEVQFGNFVTVIMCHFICSNGRKHLVEVYRVRPGMLAKIALVVERGTKLFLRWLGKGREKQS